MSTSIGYGVLADSILALWYDISRSMSGSKTLGFHLCVYGRDNNFFLVIDIFDECVFPAAEDPRYPHLHCSAFGRPNYRLNIDQGVRAGPKRVSARSRHGSVSWCQGAQIEKCNIIIWIRDPSIIKETRGLCSCWLIGSAAS